MLNQIFVNISNLFLYLIFSAVIGGTISFIIFFTVGILNPIILLSGSIILPIRKQVWVSFAQNSARTWPLLAQTET